MYVYLLHGFVTLFLSYQGWYYHVSGAEVVLVTAGCAALAVGLSSGAVRGAFRWAVEPRLDWLFRPRVPARAEEKTDEQAGDATTAARPEAASAAPHPGTGTDGGEGPPA